MGVWGTAIFSDDNASDIREEYRTLLGDGINGPEATDRLIKQWQPSISRDPDLEAVFWLALAVTQWKCGRLEDRVKREAIRVITDGSAMAPWRGGRDEAKRRRVLEDTRHQLESPQPAETKIARRKLRTCEWEPGEL